MKYRTRTNYTDSQKALMWDRFVPGAELNAQHQRLTKRAAVWQSVACACYAKLSDSAQFHSPLIQ